MRMIEFHGSLIVKLASHKKLDSSVPGNGRLAFMVPVCVDLGKKCVHRLKHTTHW